MALAAPSATSDESATTTPVIPTLAVGISGTANYGGDLYAESNAKLLYQSAYGQAGTRQWGEWEELLRTDSAVAAGLDFVCGPIRDARIDFEPADDSPEAQRVADFVRWNLTERLEPTFPELLTQATKGFLGCGFALFEPTFARVQHELLPGGSGFALDKCAQRLPNTLAFNAWLEREDGSELRAVRQQGPRGTGWLTVDIPAEQLLLFTWQRNGNNYAGFSAFRAVWYVAKIRAELLRLIGVTYQREGAGVPVASATDRSADLTPEQRSKFEKLLANLVYHENASLVAPAGWKVDWVYSGGANKGHVLDAWHRLGLAILEQVQAQQLALGTGSTGSRSVGEIHDASAMAFVSSVAATLSGVLNGVGSRPYTGLVRRLVLANGWPLALVPKLTLTLKRAQLDPLTRMDALGKAVAAGALTVTIDDENVVREQLGLSPIDEAKRDAAKAAIHAAPAFPFPPRPAMARHTASAPRSAWKPWRPLRASESRLQLAALDDYFTQRRDDFEARLRPVVTAMLAVSAPAIRDAMADGNPDEVATLPMDAVRLDAAIRAFIVETRTAGYDFAQAELAQPHRAAGEDKEEDLEVIDDADAVAEAQARALSRRIQSRLRGELEREAIDTVRTGGTADEVVRRTVERQLDTGAFRSDAGYVTTKIFNVGRDEAARIIGGVASVEYSAILDAGTCEVCTAADGQTAPFESAEHDAMLPPNRDCAGGDNCRCLLVFIPGESE